MNFKKTKVEVVKQKNPFPTLKVSSDAAIVAIIVIIIIGAI